jgi:hypothetical protein
LEMVKRVREDPEYRQSLDTLFSLAQKWLKATGNVAATAAHSFESFVDDPTPNKHLICALRCINQLVQNITGGKKLDDFYSALRTCSLDIHNDTDLQQWVDDCFAFARRALEHTGDNDPEEIRNTSEDLRRRWNVLTDLDPDKSRKWKKDFEALRSEIFERQERMEQDKDLQAVRKAHAQLGRDIEETLVDVAAVSLQGAISGASWLYADLFNVYLPRFVGILKSLPIPRYVIHLDVAFPVIHVFTVRSISMGRLNLCSKISIYLLSVFSLGMFSSATSPTLRLLLRRRGSRRRSSEL